MQLADGVDVVRRAQRQRRHVELRAVAVVVAAEREEVLAAIAEVAPAAGEVGLDLVEGEGVVAGGHRRVRGEDRALADAGQRVLERQALLEELVDALQHDEAGVAFVQVPHRGIEAEGAHGADAADAQDDLLLDARLAIAAVEARRQLAIPGRVLLEIGVEQVEMGVSQLDVPHRDQHRALAERHGDDARLAVGRDRRLDRGVFPAQAPIALFLPAVGRDALVEVALRIHEADADERQAQVARFLAVIAGQHAEAAGVDRQRLVQRELGREVGDAARRAGAVALRPPAALAAAGAVERLDRLVVAVQEDRVARRLLQPLRRHQPQQADRIVRRAPPQPVVQLPENRAGRGVPDPPDVRRELGEAADAVGKRGSRDGGLIGHGAGGLRKAPNVPCPP